MRLICTGYNEIRVFGKGWYGLERSPEGILYRASSRQAILHLPTKKPIELGLFLSARPEHMGEALCVVVEGEPGSGFRFDLTTNGWVYRRGAIVPGKERMICITIQNPWSPDRLYENGDVRSLGILLSALRID